MKLVQGLERGPDERLWCRWSIAQRRVWALGVVVPAPAFDDDLGFLESVEDLAVEQLFAKLGVEALAVAVLPGAAGLDVGCAGADRRDPVPEGLGDELRPIVGTDVAGDAAQDEQVSERVNDIDGLEPAADPDGEALASELVDDVEHPILPPVMGAILDEVVGPDMVGIFGPQANTGSVVEPEPPALGLLVRNLQPLASPDPVHPLDPHHPARPLQHHRDPAIAIATILGGKGNDVGGQGRLVIGCSGDLALRRSMLTQNPACPSFGDTQFRHHMINAGPATRGA